VWARAIDSSWRRCDAR